MAVKKYEAPSEEMTVTLDIEGESLECAVITIIEVDSKDYIILTPIVDEDDPDYGETWYFGYEENPDDPNEEPKLRYIDSDEELELVDEAFDEYLDTQEFNEIIDEEDEE